LFELAAPNPKIAGGPLFFARWWAEMGNCPDCVKALGNSTDCMTKAKASPEDEEVVVSGDRWTALGGTDLEKPLRDESVKLVNAGYLVELAESDAELPLVLGRRQELPPEAFVTLSELKNAGSATLKTEWNDLDEEWLPIIVVSWPWLSPKHPDPSGENVRLIASTLQAFIRNSQEANRPSAYGVLLDYTAIPQGERTSREDQLFESGLSSLGLFYSHPSTIVFKVTSLPLSYPSGYGVPEGAHTSQYGTRGWCYAEAAVSGLVKSANKVLDLAKLPNSQTLWNIMEKCRSERTPPVHPDDFRKELASKTFAISESSIELVALLYVEAFQRHLGKAQTLDYSNLDWESEDARRLMKALEECSKLQSLNLGKNKLGPQGANSVAATLQRPGFPLVELNLGGNAILVDGAKSISDALVRNEGLRTLNLQSNRLGEKGAKELAAALESSSAKLTALNLSLNSLGAEGGEAIGKALAVNRTLTSLDLGENMLGSQGAIAVGRALQSNSSLTLLNLQRNGVDPEGAKALASGLQNNRTLNTLKLQDNFVGDEGADAFLEALLTNSSLRCLNLLNNHSSLACAQRLQEALASKEVEIYVGTSA